MVEVVADRRKGGRHDEIMDRAVIDVKIDLDRVICRCQSGALLVLTSAPCRPYSNGRHASYPLVWVCPDCGRDQRIGVIGVKEYAEIHPAA